MNHNNAVDVVYIEEIAVVAKNMSVSWDSQSAKLVLHDINFSVTKVFVFIYSLLYT